MRDALTPEELEVLPRMRLAVARVDAFRAEDVARLLDIIDRLDRNLRAALAARSEAGAEGHAHGIDYDPEYKWLVHTEEDGASAIVARDVPAWFGVRVVAAFDYMAAALAETEPEGGTGQ